jgi:histidinol-phosphate aminotransferase
MSADLRPNIRAMAGYTPGEQPRDNVTIKLNTNENPYPPSPRVFEALRQAITADRLRRYPDPLGTAFRLAAGRVLGVDPDGILIGNGSDDVLTIVTRAWVPEGGLVVSPSPSYLLYNTLAAIQGARFHTVPFTPDWDLPSPWPVHEAHLTFLASPNSPSGTSLAPSTLQRLIEEVDGPLVIDEAYVDFADAHALSLARQRNVIVVRSLSKSYALAGVRFGFAVADPALVRELIKVKDSYNCDVLSLVAATAAIEDQDYLQSTRARIRATRQRLTAALRALGFDVTPSQANFVWCRHAHRPVQPIYQELKKRMILVRYMPYEGYGDGLRITIGTDAEIDKLVEELQRLL